MGKTLNFSLQLLLIIVLIPLATITHAKEKKSCKNDDDSHNELSIFVGATSNFKSTAFSAGVAYQYRLTKFIGVGALVDYADGNIESAILGPSVFFHVSNWEFTVAPVAEFSDGDTKFVLRTGVAYEFKLKGFSISPEVNLDTERDNEFSLVYGVSFGVEF
jgi:hypothetical protein